MTIKRNVRSREARKAVSLLMLESREIPATEFKARCLEIMDEVERLGVEVIITKHRRPVARLAPVVAGRGTSNGFLRGAILYEGDIVSPIDVDWEADAPDPA